MIKVKRHWYCCCIVGLFCASAMAGGPDAEFYFSADGDEPGAGGDLTINVLPGGGTVCVDLYARSLTGATFASLGTEVTFNETANFSGGGTLDADCASSAIDTGHAFICTPNQWSTRLINPGPNACTAGPGHFIHAAGGPPRTPAWFRMGAGSTSLSCATATRPTPSVL